MIIKTEQAYLKKAFYKKVALLADDFTFKPTADSALSGQEAIDYILNGGN